MMDLNMSENETYTLAELAEKTGLTERTVESKHANLHRAFYDFVI